MDTFFDSSWYFLRYLSAKNDAEPWGPGQAEDWAPVDQYTGGAEHAVMHLMYARFFTKALRDVGLLNFDEPFLRLYNQGHIIADGAKMSKSRGNVVAPDEYVAALGADIVRTYLMFVGPWDRGGDWSDGGINGIARWYNRVWDIWSRDPAGLTSSDDSDGSRELRRKLHQTMRKVYTDLDAFKFNTAIAAMMELTNLMQHVWEDNSASAGAWNETRRAMLVLLAPIAPHLAEELWERLGEGYSVHGQSFPEWDDDLAAEETVTLVVQVDGRVRDRLSIAPDLGEAAAKGAGAGAGERAAAPGGQRGHESRVRAGAAAESGDAVGRQVNLLRGSWTQIALLVSLIILFVLTLLGIMWALTEWGNATWMTAAAIVQSVGTVTAIFAGGVFAFYRLNLLRTFQPHLNIEHEVSHRPVGNRYIHIAVTANLRNTSRVAIPLLFGTTILQQVSPNSDQTVEDLYRRGRVDRELDHFYWPFLEQVDQNYDTGSVVIEPGGVHPHTVEFLIDAAVRSIVIYTFCGNSRAGADLGRSKGWSATTVYDIN